MKYIFILLFVFSVNTVFGAEGKDKTDYTIIEKAYPELKAVYPFHYNKCYFSGNAYIVIDNNKILLIYIGMNHRYENKKIRLEKFIGVIP